MITLDNIRDQLRNRWAFALPVVDTIEARAKADTAYAADLSLWLAGVRSTVHLRDNIMEPIRHLPPIIAIGKKFNPTTEWDNTWMPLDTAAHLAKLEVTLPAPTFNCLPAGETLEDLCRRDHICGFDLAFVADATPFRDSDTFGSDMQVCNPSEATRATIYAMNDLGESIAVHDVELTEAGADQVAATCRALFSAIVLAHRPQPDAAQIHQAEQDRISDQIRESMRGRFAQLAGIDLGGNDQTVIATIGPNGEVGFSTGALQEDDGEPD